MWEPPVYIVIGVLVILTLKIANKVRNSEKLKGLLNKIPSKSKQRTSKSKLMMLDYDNYCQDCKRSTEIVLDHASGDSICSECGLILEPYFIDKGYEWRNKDLKRVGNPFNPLLNHGNLSTTMSSKTQRAEVDFQSPWWSTHVTNPDNALNKSFESIATMADGLSVMETIKHRANEIFKNVKDGNTCRGRKQNAVMAACLFIACREHKSTRTLREISSVADGATRKEISRAIGNIKKRLDVNAGAMNASELVRRFCSNLGMTNQATKAVHEAIIKSEYIDIRRNPNSVLAAIIYIITQLSDEEKPLQDIALAAKVTAGTIKKSYRDVYPHASRLIPNWYAKEEDIKRLCRP